ncbi:MAG: FecR domain-containing protein [Candidatus Omnitrophota bacterium]
MKKLALFLICIVFIIFSAGAFAQTPKILKTKGDVKVKKAGQDTWKKAQKNMSVDKGDQIKTGSKSQAIVAFDERADKAVRIEELTEIRLNEIEPPRRQIELPRGDLFSKIENLEANSTFEIKTPTSVAGVRGTGWKTGFRNKEASVAVFDGSVNFAGRTFMQGEAGLFRDGRLTVGRLLDADRDRWDSFRNDVRDIKGLESKERQIERSERVAPMVERTVEQIEQTSERRFDDTRQQEKLEERQKPSTGDENQYIVR